MSLLAAADLHVPGRLEGVSVALRAGELTALVGPNGAGKSTLMQALAGLLPAGDRVTLDGRPLASMPVPDRARKLAWAGQEAHFEFAFPVREVVAQGRYAWADDGAGVDEALAELDLTHLADRPVTRLSGGERQRVLLARALATGAPVQLWDEPTAYLDARHGLQVLKLARRLADQGHGLMLSLHDLRVALCFDRVVVLDRGRVAAAGQPESTLTPALIEEVFGVRAKPGESLILELP